MISELGDAAIGFGVIVAGVFVGWQNVQTKRAARQAAVNSHPISNGWGESLRKDMGRMADAVERLDERQNANDERQNSQDRRVQALADRVSIIEGERRELVS